MRIAAIDIGTNSVHMIIAMVYPHGKYEIITRAKDMVRLGKGGLSHSILQEDAIERAIESLKRMKKIAESRNVDEIVAVATSAVREARNGGQFLQRINDDINLRVQTIQGDEEARLIYLGVAHAVELAESRSLIIDIGGGSIEFILADKNRALYLTSIKAGVARLKEMFISRDPPTVKEIKALQLYVKKLLHPIRQEIKHHHGFSQVIGTSGTILNLCELANGRRIKKKQVFLGIDKKEIDALFEQLLSLSPKERELLIGFDKKRGDLTVVGAALLSEIFDILNIKKLESCEQALREGIILQYVEKHRPDLMLEAKETDMQRRSVHALMHRYLGDNAAHANHVAHLALQLFDGLIKVHQLKKESRDLLEYAALLHDIGCYVSTENHEQHSYYLITQSRMPGFSKQEQHLLALLSKAHRKIKIKLTQEELSMLTPLQKKQIKPLVLLLKLANSLDRSHARVVNNLILHIHKKQVEIIIQTTHDVEIELWTAHLYQDLFIQIFGKKLILTVNK